MQAISFEDPVAAIVRAGSVSLNITSEAINWKVVSPPTAIITGKDCAAV